MDYAFYIIVLVRAGTIEGVNECETDPSSTHNISKLILSVIELFLKEFRLVNCKHQHLRNT